MEQRTRIERASLPWKGKVLPLNERCNYTQLNVPCQLPRLYIKLCVPFKWRTTLP